MLNMPVDLRQPCSRDLTAALRSEGMITIARREHRNRAQAVPVWPEKVRYLGLPGTACEKNIRHSERTKENAQVYPSKATNCYRRKEGSCHPRPISWSEMDASAVRRKRDADWVDRSARPQWSGLRSSSRVNRTAPSARSLGCGSMMGQRRRWRSQAKDGTFANTTQCSCVEVEPSRTSSASSGRSSEDTATLPESRGVSLLVPSTARSVNKIYGSCSSS